MTTRKPLGRNLARRRSARLLPVLGLSILCGCVAHPPVDTGALYATVRQASVFILVNERHAGSGFFVGPDGLVMTAAHVVKGKTDGIEVVSPAAGRLKAERVAADLGHDIAVLRVPARAAPYPALPVAERLPPAGSQVFLMGDPVFRHHVFIGGFVSVAEPTFSYSSPQKCYIRVIYIDGVSPDGTSGGCWVDLSGRVVGVQSAYLNVRDGVPAWIAMVAPPDAIRGLLATRRSPEVATLGTRLDELWTQPEGFIARFPKGTEGVVTNVPIEGGPVQQAGLTRESLITGADGRRVAYIDDLMAVVRSKKPGDEVTLEVLDPDNKPKRTVKVRLGKVQE